MTTETSTSIDPSAFFGHLTFNTDEMAKRLPPPSGQEPGSDHCQRRKARPFHR